MLQYRSTCTAKLTYSGGVCRVARAHTVRVFQPMVHCVELQALVYNVLPPTPAIADYAIGLKEKLSANELFFDDAQKAARL